MGVVLGQQKAAPEGENLRIRYPIPALEEVPLMLEEISSTEVSSAVATTPNLEK